MNVLRIVVAAFVLQAAPQQSQSALIEGRVVGPAGNPLSKVTIVLQGLQGDTASLQPTPNAAAPHADIQTMISNSDGNFSFDKLLPGTYRLTASRAGFTKSEFGQKGPNGPGTPITISRDQKLRNIVLTIAPMGAVTGRVQDRDGLPVVRATVQALKFSYRGPLQGPALSAVQSVTSDDNGEYRLFWLPPGNYVIGAIPNSSPAVNVALTATPRETTVSVASLTNSGSTVVRKSRSDGSFEEEIAVPSYYPGTSNFADATRVLVRPGETVTGIDFKSQFAPSHRIRGVITPDVSPSIIPITIQLVARKSARESMMYMRTSETGFFDISGVVPGEYLLNGNPIVVGDSNLDNLVLSPITALIPVEGKITLEGAVAGEIMRNVATRLSFVGLTYNFVALVLVQPDGSFRANLATGDYLILMDGDPANNERYLKSVRFGNQDGLEVVHVSGKPESPMEVVLGSAKGRVDARILDDRHQPVLNATVVLIPNPPRRHRTDMYLTATPDAMGRFHFNAAPGEYKIFGWEDIEAGAWLDTDFMVKQESRGQPVSIREGIQDAIDVTVIPYAP